MQEKYTSLFSHVLFFRMHFIQKIRLHLIQAVWKIHIDLMRIHQTSGLVPQGSLLIDTMLTDIHKRRRCVDTLSFVKYCHPSDGSFSRSPVDQRSPGPWIHQIYHPPVQSDLLSVFHLIFHKYGKLSYCPGLWSSPYSQTVWSSVQILHPPVLLLPACIHHRMPGSPWKW